MVQHPAVGHLDPAKQAIMKAGGMGAERVVRGQQSVFRQSLIVHGPVINARYVLQFINRPINGQFAEQFTTNPFVADGHLIEMPLIHKYIRVFSLF